MNCCQLVAIDSDNETKSVSLDQGQRFEDEKKTLGSTEIRSKPGCLKDLILKRL